MNGDLVEGRAVRVPEAGAVLPPACACCGAPAGTSAALTRNDGLTLIVGYCDECQHHRTLQGTRTISIVLASCLLGLAVAAGLPLAWVWVRAPVYLLLVLVSALVPITFALFRTKQDLPHTSHDVAAWWLDDGRLFCTNGRYAAELAALNQCEAELFTLKRSPLSAWLFAGVVLSVAAAWFFFWLYHPLLRVLNLTDSRIELFADGRLVANLDPTSLETSAAGSELYLPAGQRALRTISTEGAVVSELSVRIEPGAQHLYAPGASEYCFWLEIQGYGRGADLKPKYYPLEGDSRFWVLRARIDNWFAPNPPASEESARLSGGTATALRQARCTDLH